jgi:signal transduction histidine kinase
MIWIWLIGACGGSLSLSVTESSNIVPAVVAVADTASASGPWAALPETRFHGVVGKRVDLGRGNSPHLLRIILDTKQAGRWWLVSEGRTPGHIGLEYNGKWLGEFGTAHPFSQRPLSTTVLAVALDSRAGLDTLVLRVQESYGRNVLQARLVPDRLLPVEMKRRAWLDAGVIGFLSLVMLFSLYLWGIMRDRSFAWYCLYVLGSIAWIATKRGVAFEWFWPDFPALNPAAAVSLSSLAVASFMLFLCNILNVSLKAPRLGALLGWSSLLLLCSGLFSVTAAFVNDGWFEHVERIQILLQVLVLVLGVALLVIRAIAGESLARRFLLTFAPLGVASFLGTTSELGLVSILPGTKVLLVMCAGMLENLLTTLVLVGELRQRELARLNLERDFHLRLTERFDSFCQGLAHDLHDNLGHKALLLRLSVHKHLGTASPGSRQEVDGQFKELIESLRENAHRLLPPLLERGEFLLNLRGLCYDLERAGRKVTFQASGDDKLVAPVKAIHLFRIAQEAIANAISHGSAKEVRVIVDIDSTGRICMEVRDDGVGMQTDSIKEGLGLAGIRSRVLAMGGKQEIHSRPGRGAVISVVVPAGMMGPAVGDRFMGRNETW